jgi:uncharacterized protein (TIGR02231 family)
MKKTTITVLHLIIAFLVTGQPRDLRSDMKIIEVTVYTTGARIFGEKKVEIPSGTSTLRFTGVSSKLDAGSIQVAAEGNVTILSVNSELDFLSEKEQGMEVRNLVKKRDELVKATEKEKLQVEILDKEMQFMEANMKVTGTSAVTRVTELAPMADYFTSKITAITTGRKWRNDSIRSWTEQINKINSQIGDLISQQKNPGGVIAVNIDAPQKSSVLFKISYLIRDAGWVPAYDIRVANIESPAMITYKASIFQNSGTDWKDVKLRFSSANPSQRGVLPVLSPWWLNIREEPPIRAYGIRGNKMLKVAEVQDAAAEMVAMPMSMVREEAGTTVEFVMVKLFSVPSNGKNHLVDLTTESVQATYSYITVPKIDPVAHLTAKLTGWEQLSLLPGDANVFFEGSFTGKTFLNPNDFSDTLELSLGIDRNISVQREMEKELSSTRFLASKTEVTKSWKISVRNNKSEKITILVSDQLPLSANSDIEVTDTRISGGKLNTETGVVKWLVKVKTAEKSERSISWTVRYPKGKKINLDE